MNVFIIHSGVDYIQIERILKTMKQNVFSLNPLMLENGGTFWKTDAAKKIRQSQIVLFFIGSESYKSDNIAWELLQAKKYNKPIYSILLSPENQRHPALAYTDDFSGKEKHYHDILISKSDFETLINDHEYGKYQVFNQPMEELDKALLLEQYKVFLQTSEDLVSRRQNVNNFYISINSVMIALFSVFVVFDLSETVRMLLGLLFSFVGLILATSWIRILNAYGNLNGSKMKIISSIEKQLPASLFDAEWAALSDRLNKKKYVSFTDSEKKIPAVFMFVYTTILVFVFVSLILQILG